MAGYETLTEYRLSRFSDNYSDYMQDWVDISDIGKTFKGEILTKETVYRTVRHLLDAIEFIYKKAGSPAMRIYDLSDGMHLCPFYPTITLKTKEEVCCFLRDAMLGLYWGRLDAPDLFFYPANDLMIDFGTLVQYKDLRKYAMNNDLFITEHPSDLSVLRKNSVYLKKNT